MYSIYLRTGSDIIALSAEHCPTEGSTIFYQGKLYLFEKSFESGASFAFRHVEQEDFFDKLQRSLRTESCLFCLTPSIARPLCSFHLGLLRNQFSDFWKTFLKTYPNTLLKNWFLNLQAVSRELLKPRTIKSNVYHSYELKDGDLLDCLAIFEKAAHSCEFGNFISYLYTKNPSLLWDPQQNTWKDSVTICLLPRYLQTLLMDLYSDISNDEPLSVADIIQKFPNHGITKNMIDMSICFFRFPLQALPSGTHSFGLLDATQVSLSRHPVSSGYFLRWI